MQQAVRPASHKFVLVALADCVRKGSSVAWPSVAELAESTGMDRKTVLHALDQLIDAKVIDDTGERKGRTGQVRVFSLVMVVDNPPNDPENGTVKGESNSTEIPDETSKEYRFSHVTVPILPSNGTENGIRNQEGTSKGIDKTKKPRKRVDVSIPDWLPAEAWAEWLDHRGAKYTALAAVKTLKALSEFRDAGADPVAVLDRSIANGWKGIFELPRAGKQAQAPPRMNANAQAAAAFGTTRFRNDPNTIEADATLRPNIKPFARLG